MVKQHPFLGAICLIIRLFIQIAKIKLVRIGFSSYLANLLAC